MLWRDTHVDPTVRSSPSRGWPCPAALKRAAAELRSTSGAGEPADVALDRKARALIVADPQLRALASANGFNAAYLVALKRVAAEPAPSPTPASSRVVRLEAPRPRVVDAVRLPAVAMF